MSAVRTSNAPWILVVDRDAHACFLLRRVIAAEGYRVLTAGSLSQAAALLDDFPRELVRAAFIAFPAGESLAAVAVDSLACDLPVVLVGGQADRFANEASAACQAVDALWKPFSREEVRRLLRRHAARQPSGNDGTAARADS